MMHAISPSAHNQKDFFDGFLDHIDDAPSPASTGGPSPISDLLHPSVGAGEHSDPSSNMQQQPIQNGVGMDVLEGLMAMQDNRGSQSSSMASSSQPPPQLLMEQQMRLNQLQQLYQLQTQIFQQQIELLSGQSSFMPLVQMDRPREQQQYLPTPAASTELAPQPSPEFVPPMLLQNNDGNNVGSSQNTHSNNQQPYIPHSMVTSAPHSAPANIVFQNIQSPYPVAHGGDLEFDEMSPLTSPWLAPYQGSSDGSGPSRGMQQQQHHTASSSTGTKRRTASPGSDDMNPSGRPSRKRQAPGSSRLSMTQTNVGPMIPSMGRARRSSLRGTKSASSTPLFPPIGAPGSMTPNFPPSRGGRGPLREPALPNEHPGDTPSPVDLSMPPPAAPQPQTPMGFGQNVGHGDPASLSPQGPIQPVTPSIIMNLGRLGTESSLTPSNVDSGSHQSGQGRSKSKANGRPRSATTTSGNKNAPVASNPALVSPALKPIRPAGPPSVASSMSPTGPVGSQPPLQVRKTSHKAAEQKRRDSLKTSFDDLRVLLPPIPLPSDEGFPDEPILPGAMPPRGPPKGNVDGPNRGVSKLQLLRCGNDYIRRLNGRVERRDVEIERLRREIARLRIVAGTEAVPEGEEPLDLEADIDAVEINLGPLGRSAALLDDDQGDEDGVDS